MRRPNFFMYTMTLKYKLKHIFQFCHVLNLFDRKRNLTLYIYMYISAINITTTSLKTILHFTGIWCTYINNNKIFPTSEHTAHQHLRKYSTYLSANNKTFKISHIIHPFKLCNHRIYFCCTYEPLEQIRNV
jgi:hypothetical protein